MSRIAKRPVVLPKGTEVKRNGGQLNVKGPKGALDIDIHPAIAVAENDDALSISDASAAGDRMAMAGTMRALLANVVKGVTDGFEKKLELNGVGYRAQSQGKNLTLTLGFSHPVVYAVPDGVTIETPSQTEIVVKGCDKQQVGQVAAEIRSFRPPEPYKGKGVRYADERVVRKEAKKK
jgi:large subunit ribosomal protein L6